MSTYFIHTRRLDINQGTAAAGAAESTYHISADEASINEPGCQHPPRPPRWQAVAEEAEEVTAPLGQQTAADGPSAGASGTAARIVALMTDAELAPQRMRRLHELLDGQPGRRVVLVLCVALEQDWFTRLPSYDVLRAEFPFACSRTYFYDLQQRRFSSADKEAVRSLLLA